MLALKEVVAGYDESLVLKGITLEVKEGEIVALLGPNGAGKSTTLKTILGLVCIRSGAIEFMGRRIDNRPTAEIVRSGISMVFEGRRVFPELSVTENLIMGGYTLGRSMERKRKMESVFLRFPRIAQRHNQMAGSLSGGEQQMLAIGRALMSDPTLLIMDEPSMGLAPSIVDEVFSIISEINARGTTILLVEQNANRALEIASRAYVLESGEVVLSDTASQLIGHGEIEMAYLGGGV
ncbi:MAG: ABC transporter ATP-binding protein [Bacillota bacterium]|jgi:branched-chain amino acid transport system ATP-binding protein